VAVTLNGAVLTASVALGATPQNLTWTSPPLTAGDVVILVVDMNAASANFPASASPTGGTGLVWTSVVSETNTAAHFSAMRAWWTNVPTTHTPASIVTAISATGTSVSAMGALYRLTGADTVNPIGQVGVFQGQTDPTGTALQITGTTAGSLIIMGASDWSAGVAAHTITISGVGTSTTDLDTATTDFRGISAHGDQSASTNQGTLDYTAATGDWAAAIFEVKAASSGTATPPARPANPGQTWKRHFQHHQTRQLDPPPAAPVASAWLPGLTIPRRSLRKVPFFRTNPGTDVPDGNQLQPPSVRKGQIRSRRRFPLPGRSGSLSAPPDVLSTFVSAKRRTRRVPKLTSEGDSYSPPWTQVAPVNPAITQTVTGRVRAILRGQRRGQTGAGQPTPAQIVTVTNPAITQLTTGRFLKVLQRQRRGATGSMQWSPNQVQPPFVVTRSWRKAFRPRYGRTPTVVPPQQAATPNPPITQFGSLWAKRWTMRRYGRVANPTPAQQALPTNPGITQLVTGRAIKVLRAQRRGKTGAEQWRPAQQAVAANPSITQLVSVRIRLVIRALRRPQASKPVPEQVTPLPPTHHAQRPMASRRGHVSGPPIPQPVPPPRLVVERVKRPTRRIRRALGRFIPGGTAPTSTAVSSVGSTPPTVSEVGSVSAEVETESATGPGGVGSVSGIDETGSTSGSGMTGSAS
jgi:hypothetical protein